MPKAKKDGKPKRAPTAFILWSNDNREAVKKENASLSFGEVGKVLGDKWKSVSTEEKAKYEEISAQRKLDWQKNMAAWNAEHPDEESESNKKGKGKGKGRAKKDKDAPKGATNAYMMFSKQQREKFKAEGKKLSFGEVGKLISEKWKALSDEDKKPFVELAEKDKKRHEKEMEEYKKKGGKVEKPAAAGGKKAKKEEKSSSSSSEEKSSSSSSSESSEESDAGSD